MSITLGVIMDPIESINIKKDTTFAIMLEAQKRGWRILCMRQQDLIYKNNTVRAVSRALVVFDTNEKWFEAEKPVEGPLTACDAILMRKDPPFDQEYLYTTYMLDHVDRQGTLVVNAPRALRDWNEKFAITMFPELCPATLISRDPKALQAFCHQHNRVVYKRLDTMGGKQIFQASHQDKNLHVILETLTQDGQRTIMAQEYLDAITDGDKRILIVDGDVIPHGLARVPSDEDFRGNLARGASATGFMLSDSDRSLAEQIAPHLREHNILLAGIDVIGDRLTEINITSPTCVREIDRAYDTNIAATICDALSKRLEIN